jgi:hypothetical protein
MQNKRIILSELLNSQLINIDPSKKLSYNDITRIVKNVSTSLFSNDSCCIWEGYVTNINRNHKTQYINFYFKDKKITLHRLLYINFIGELKDTEYLKFSCDNRGKCCNINHIIKYLDDNCNIDCNNDGCVDNSVNDNKQNIDKSVNNKKIKYNKTHKLNNFNDFNDFNDFKISFD